jgi:hypothetical protein
MIFIVLGCQPKKTDVLAVNIGYDPSVYDNAPFAYDITVQDINEDTETDWIYLKYSDPDNDEITECQISNRTYLVITQKCICNSGICKVKLKPSLNYFGPVSFNYSVTANNLTSPLANASFTVLAVGDFPVANDLNISMVENKVLFPNSYVSSGKLSKPHLSGYDPDGDAITCEVVTNPLHAAGLGGLFALNQNCSFKYEPDFDYDGLDSFKFRVKDPQGNVSSAKTVNINISKYNEAPLANAASVETYSNKPIAITLTGSDPNGDSLVYNILQSPANGILSGSGENLIYSPNNNFYGADSFTFMVSDMFLNSSPVTVNINVLKSTLFLATTGNDATAVISDPTKPFQTAQGAVNAAIAFSPYNLKPLVIQVSPGTYGNIVLNSNFGNYITWTGALGSDPTNTILGDISANGTNGANGTVAIGDWNGKNGGNSFTIKFETDFLMSFGNVSANGGNGGYHYPDPSSFTSKPGLAGRAGAVTLKGIFGTISAKGGEGHGGGLGGAIYLMNGSKVNSVDASGGQIDRCSQLNSCKTSIDSSIGGTILIETGSIVTGAAIAKGGANNGVFTDRRLAGQGGTITIDGTVTGIVEAKGGDTVDSKVGAGGTISISQTGIVSGPSVSVVAGTGSSLPLGNNAGTINVSGTASNLFLQSGTHLESFGGAVNIYGVVNNINGQGYGAYCTHGRAAIVKIYPTGKVTQNVNLTGGDGSCTSSTGGILYVAGIIEGSAILVGAAKDVTHPWISAGGGGYAMVYSTGEVKSISVQGGSAGSGTNESGGDGGKITLVYGSKINGIVIDGTSSTNPLLTPSLIFSGGFGDPTPASDGAPGTITYQP